MIILQFTYTFFMWNVKECILKKCPIDFHYMDQSHLEPKLFG